MINTVYAIKKVNTQTWDKTGKRLTVTIAELPELKVTQIKTQDQDGYQSIQVGFGSKKAKNETKPVRGHLKSGDAKEVARYLKEVNLASTDTENPIKVGDTLKPAEVFEVGDIINVTSFTKGTGFTGVMKRWNFAGGPRTHGQSDRERAPGSIGQGTDPGRVWKGKKMAGRDGHLKVTQQNLMIVKIDKETGEVWIKGTTPGHRGSLLTVKRTGHKDFPGLFLDKPEPVQESSEAAEKSEVTKEAKAE